MGPEGQTGKLRPYVADIDIHLWGRDLLQQRGIQNNPEIPRTVNVKIRVDMINAPGEVIDMSNLQQSHAVLIVQKQDIIEIEFPNL